MYVPEQKHTYTTEDFARDQTKVLNNLQQKKTKREFDAALKIAEKSIIYQENPAVVMKRLSTFLHAPSPKPAVKVKPAATLDQPPSQAKIGNHKVRANKAAMLKQAKGGTSAPRFIKSNRDKRNNIDLSKGGPSELHDIQETDQPSSQQSGEISIARLNSA